MKREYISTGILSLFFAFSAQSQNRPNVVLIIADDLNDWVGALGGNPQVITTNMDKFCRENAMIFKNAHAAGPLCCPSRSALLSGFRPETTGCYTNSRNMRESVLIQQYATLPEYFSKNGYLTISRGKIFHRHQTEAGQDMGQWAFDVWEPVKGNGRIQRDKLYSRFEGLYNGVKRDNYKYEGGKLGSVLEWAPTIAGKEETVDFLTAQWFAKELKKDYEKPFFMAVGFQKPHLIWNVPQEYFDRYSIDTIKIPEYRLNDLDDILTPSGEMKFKPTDDFLWLQQDENLFKHAVRAYMASITYVDECMGIVLDALKKSRYDNNTIVIIMGDHGWHLGEKLRFQKNTLWSESTRTPLMIRTTDMIQKSECNRVVNLIDLFPTLIELCGLPKRDILEGRSFMSLLKNPDKKWPYPSITTYAGGSLTMNDETWRYTKYKDGTEELYNLQKDPMEWENLITSKDKEAIKAKARLEKWIPKYIAPDLPINKVDIRDSGIINKPDLTIDKTRPLEKLK